MKRLAISAVLLHILLLADVCVNNAAILKVGTPLPWNAAKPHLTYVRDHGVKQFFNQYQRMKSWKSPEFLWGDEIEVGVFKKDSTGKFDLSLRGPELLRDLTTNKNAVNEKDCDFQPEYGAWMVHQRLFI
jgi:glutamate--cysteine ligase catalytic subunit